MKRVVVGVLALFFVGRFLPGSSNNGKIFSEILEKFSFVQDVFGLSADRQANFLTELDKLVNQARVAQGLRACGTELTELKGMAQTRAREICQDFAHRRYLFWDWSTILTGEFANYSAAENIAGGQKTPAEVVQAWMNSPGHRANLLGNYTYFATGMATKGNDYYWCILLVDK